MMKLFRTCELDDRESIKEAVELVGEGGLILLKPGVYPVHEQIIMKDGLRLWGC